jgi:hypothetical protein
VVGVGNGKEGCVGMWKGKSYPEESLTAFLMSIMLELVVSEKAKWYARMLHRY